MQWYAAMSLTSDKWTGRLTNKKMIKNVNLFWSNVRIFLNSFMCDCNLTERCFPVGQFSVCHFSKPYLPKIKFCPVSDWFSTFCAFWHIKGEKFIFPHPHPQTINRNKFSWSEQMSRATGQTLSSTVIGNTEKTLKKRRRKKKAILFMFICTILNMQTSWDKRVNTERLVAVF